MDDIELASGGAVGLGVSYGVSSDGKTSQIAWTDGTWNYTLTSGQNGVTVTHR